MGCAKLFKRFAKIKVLEQMRIVAGKETKIPFQNTTEKGNVLINFNLQN